MDIRELDRRAQELILGIVARAGPEDLTRPTPCADWTLYGLIRHLISQDEGFAAAARGGGARLAAWRNGRLGADPAADYGAAARLVADAFAEDGVLEREFVLPVVRDGGAFPAAAAIGFHFVDLVVHAWDVAAAIGAPWEPAEDLTAAALRIAERVPDDPESRGPGLAFEPTLSVAAGTPPRERLLRLLGRDPDWRAP